MSIESMVLSNHLIICCLRFLLPSILPSIRVFSSESALCIRWTKYRSSSISASNEYPGLISFGIPWTPHSTVSETPPSLHTHYDMKWALGCLGPAVRLQELALTVTTLRLTSGSGFTCQWVGNSPRVFRTLTLPTSEPALAPGPSRVLQPAASWPGPAKQKPKASAQDRARQPTILGSTQAYQIAHIISPPQQKGNH